MSLSVSGPFELGPLCREGNWSRLSRWMAMHQDRLDVVEYQKNDALFFHVLVMRGAPMDMLDWFVRKDPTLVNKRDAHGRTPLMIACRGEDDYNFIGINGLTRDDEHNLAIVGLLLQHGANPRMQSTEGLNSLHYAALRAHGGPVIDALLTRDGALVGQLTSKGHSAYRLARQVKASADIVQRLYVEGMTAVPDEPMGCWCLW